MYDEQIVDQVLDGLKVYFDKCLGNVLLYRFERSQYVEMKERFPDLAPSDIYGAEHLLRLFGMILLNLSNIVQLPTLIAHTAMDQETITTLKDHFALLLKYLTEHEAELFSVSYDNASAAYLDQQKVSVLLLLIVSVDSSVRLSEIQIVAKFK